MSELFKHEFMDTDIERAIDNSGRVELVLKPGTEAILIRESDAIAIAKHFCLVVGYPTHKE